MRERTACTIWLFSSSCFCFSSSRILACHSAALSLAEYVSATAMGSAIALMVISALLGWLIRNLTRNENLGYGVGLSLMAVTTVFYLIDSTKFEGLLPDIMKKLSLFDRLDTFVNGVFDLTAVVFYLSVAAFFLFLTVQSLEKRRYN